MVRFFNRWILLSAGFFMLFSIAAVAENENWPDARRLLIESVGGDSAVAKLKSIKAIETFGTINVNGSLGRYHMIVSPPDKIFVDVQHELYSEGMIIHGETGWQKSLNGKFVPMGSIEIDEAHKSLAAESFGYILHDSGQAPIAVDSLAETMGHICWAINTTPDDEFGTMIFIDTLSRQIIAIEWIQGNTVSRIEYTSFDTVSGVIYPMSSTKSLKGTHVIVVEHVDSVLFKTAFDTSFMVAPKQESTTLLQDGKQSVKIPISYHNGHLVLTTTIHGKRKRRLILDTGSSLTVLSRRATKGLEFRMAGKAPFRSMVGASLMSLIVIDTMNIGPVEITNQVVGYVKDSTFPPKIDGVLGYDFFANAPITINRSRSCITIHDPGTFHPDENAIAIPFEFYSGVPVIVGSVCGNSARFIVDLGNAIEPIVSARFCAALERDSCFTETDQKVVKASGIDADYLVHTFSKVKEFSLGTLSRRDLLVLRNVSSDRATVSNDIAGNLGASFFKPYEITFDYPHQMIYLKP